MIRGKVAIVLQARMGSARLPGKSLAPIGDATLLEHCITRLRSANVGPVVVATTTLDEDDAMVSAARDIGVSVFRGDADDVLGRYVAAAAGLGAEFVVRATGDNPAVDPQSAVRLLARLRGTLADHAVEEGLPLGCTVEAVRTTVLRDAAVRAQDRSDREHVTPFIRRATSGFKCLIVPAPAAVRRPDLRFTVDTPQDLAYMRGVLDAAGAVNGGVVPLEGIIAAADSLAPGREVA